MHALVVGLIALVVMSGCAALKKTEDLPSPLPQDGPGAGRKAKWIPEARKIPEPCRPPRFEGATVGRASGVLQVSSA